MSEQPLQPQEEPKPVNNEDLPDEVKSIIEALPESQQKVVQAILLKIERTSWRGPLPPPEILKGYNDSIPDGAERILQMAEKQSRHRMEMEKLIIPKEQEQSGRGQLFAFIIAISFLLASGFLIWDGHDTAGTILGSIDLVALVSVFVYGKRQQKRDPGE